MGIYIQLKIILAAFGIVLLTIFEIRSFSDPMAIVICNLICIYFGCLVTISFLGEDDYDE